MSLPPAPVSVASLLIVDDNPIQRVQVVALCRDLGIQLIYEAASGAEALELLAMLVLPPDLMIIDLEMPTMDGVELIERLHERGLLIPLVVCSSREAMLIQTVETMARNLGMPVLAGLRKPLRPQTLAEAIASLGAGAPQALASADARALPPAAGAALARAIAGGALAVHYQPKVDMQRGVLCGVEALARWRDPELGDVRPDHFIALAEREGLIHELTWSIVTQALAQAARWNADGLQLSLAINLSPLLLEDPALVQRITALVADHGLQARQVMLEITESSVVDCMGTALGALARLRLKGFGLSIDDYGTGFSSMLQLARIPFTELKVDRSFVHGAHRRSNLRVILRSAIGMARQLHLVTVAEGIETEEDWRLAQSTNCDVGQGFLVARPMPAAELAPWAESNRARLRALGALG